MKRELGLFDLETGLLNKKGLVMSVPQTGPNA